MSYSAVTVAPASYNNFNSNYGSYGYQQTSVNPNYNYDHYAYIVNNVSSYNYPQQYNYPANNYQADYNNYYGSSNDFYQEDRNHYQSHNEYPNSPQGHGDFVDHNLYKDYDEFPSNQNGNQNQVVSGNSFQNMNQNEISNHNTPASSRPRRPPRTIFEMRKHIYDRFMTHMRNRNQPKLEDRSVGSSIAQTLLFPPTLFAFTVVLFDIMKSLMPFRPTLPSIPALFGFERPTEAPTTATTRKPKITKIDIAAPKLPTISDIIGDFSQLSKDKMKKKKKEKDWEEEDDSEELIKLNALRSRLKPKRWRVKKRRRNKLKVGLTGSQLKQFYKHYKKNKIKDLR